MQHIRVDDMVLPLVSLLQVFWCKPMCNLMLLRRCQLFSWVIGCLAWNGWVLPTTWAQQKLEFNQDIRPILSANCFRCHGFDEKKREANLRLDDQNSALAKRDSGVAIVPGNLEKSLLWERINSTDPDLVMPPPNANRQLSSDDKSKLKTWIEQGAAFEKHWIFEPLQRPTVPEPVAEFAKWQANPVDRFLIKKMLEQGLRPQDEADRHTLVRRVALTLTGLPPTISEVDQFVSDTSDKAYESMVDRFLRKPAFGEEMARHWLDVARYGDTHGLHLDNVRAIWAYRDWVVNAFNQNKPFSDFTVEQLAGDLLPNPTKDQLIATGFNRCNVTTSEGGAIKEEFLFRYAVDRTSTVVQTWIGLTGGCAVCHDHKYDPLTTREFYSLYAFFYSAADPAMDGNAIDTPPFLSLATVEQQAELQRLEGIEKAAAVRLQTVAEQLASKTASDLLSNTGSSQEPGNQATGFREIWFDDELTLGAINRNTSRNAPNWTLSEEMDIPMGRRALKQSFGHYYQEKMDGGLVLRVIPNDAQLEMFVRLDALQPSKALMVELSTSAGSRRFAWGNLLELNKGEFQDANNVYLGAMPQPGAWHRIVIGADKLNLAAGTIVNDLTLAQFGGICWWDGLVVSGTSAAEKDPRTSLAAWWAYCKGKSVPVVVAEVAAALKAGPDEKLSEGTKFQLQRDFLQYVARDVPAELQVARDAWNRTRVDRKLLNDSIPGTMIFGDLAEPRKAHIMKRGQYDQPSDEVQPGTPASLPPLKLAKPSARTNRLDLARWLISPEHPTTARVTVNRFWQQIFGTGIVKTSDDFGAQGEPPRHPELLDWLAVEFQSSGWDMQQLLRTMLSSAAFRQGSRITADSLAKDPENRLLSRGPRIRLEAEQVRDLALAVSGLLNARLGGPGFKGYQPPNIWEPVGYSDSNTRYYLQDFGPDLYRRSLYSFVKRTAPPPFMSNFDAPNREFFCTRRERSNTPLQALQLMNDVQMVEAARGLAERLLREGGLSAQSRIRHAYRLVLAREPQDDEIRLLTKTLEKFSERFRSDESAAKELLQVGQAGWSSSIQPTDLASYTLLANLILNLDEAINRN